MENAFNKNKKENNMKTFRPQWGSVTLFYVEWVPGNVKLSI